MLNNLAIVVLGTLIFSALELVIYVAKMLMDSSPNYNFDFLPLIFISVLYGNLYCYLRIEKCAVLHWLAVVVYVLLISILFLLIHFYITIGILICLVSLVLILLSYQLFENYDPL